MQNISQNTKTKFDFKIGDLWNIFLIVEIPLICVGGGTPIPLTLREPLVYGLGIAFILVFILSGVKLKMNIVTTSAFLFLSYVAISVFYSYDQQNTLSVLLFYACSFTLLFIDLPMERYEKIIFVTYIFCIVISFSIILSALVENCMLTYFKIIVNPTNSAEITASIQRELSMGAYSGLAREKTGAGFILNVGIGIAFAKFFSSGKLMKKDIVFLLSFFVALMLTGKRTLFIISFVCFVVFMLISKIKSKTFIFGYVTLFAVCMLFLVILFVPEVANIFARFMDSENLETLGNRDVLWEYVFYMIDEHWLFGAGFGSYNLYAFDKGMLIGNQYWINYAHNSYLQALGELGIIGCIFLVAFVLTALIISLRLIKHTSDNLSASYLLYFSLYIQLMVLVYSVTGNPIYTRTIVVMWFFAIGIALSLAYKFSPKTENMKLFKVRRASYE